MTVARWSFTLAGLYGLVATLALYVDRPLGAATLWVYAFAGAAAATQLMYLLIGRDPLRHRPMIPVGIVSKLSFALPVVILFGRGGVPVSSFAFALVDLALAALFAVLFVRLARD